MIARDEALSACQERGWLCPRHHEPTPAGNARVGLLTNHCRGAAMCEAIVQRAEKRQPTNMQAWPDFNKVRREGHIRKGGALCKPAPTTTRANKGGGRAGYPGVYAYGKGYRGLFATGSKTDGTYRHHYTPTLPTPEAARDELAARRRAVQEARPC